MTYRDLTYKLFGEVETISEDEFSKLLPQFLDSGGGRKTRWHSGDEIVKFASMRFGLNGEKTHSLKECGEHFGVSENYARQLERKALLRIVSKSGYGNKIVKWWFLNEAVEA
jgi:hypothetical protein